MIKRDVFLGKIEKTEERPDPLAVKSVEKTGFASNDTFLRDVGCEPVQKAWGEALKHGDHDQSTHGHGGGGGPVGGRTGSGAHSGAPAGQSTQGGAESHQTATSHGWESEGPSKNFPGEQEYSHPASNVKIQVKPSGEWTHGAIGGQSSKDLGDYLRHLHSRTESSAGMNYSGGPSLSGWSNR